MTRKTTMISEIPKFMVLPYHWMIRVQLQICGRNPRTTAAASLSNMANAITESSNMGMMMSMMQMQQQSMQQSMQLMLSQQAASQQQTMQLIVSLIQGNKVPIVNNNNEEGKN